MEELTKSRTGAGVEIANALRARTPGVLFGETRGWRYFDGPSGTQVVDGCIDTMASYMASGVSNRWMPSATAQQTEGIIATVRRELEVLVRGAGYRVVFGQNMTSLAWSVAHAVAAAKAHSETSVLISELEHFGNVTSWSRTFAERGAETRWIPVDPQTLRLEEGAAERLLEDGDVALVAITLAANAIGTVPPVAAIAEAAHRQGALVVVDGVQAMPHQQVDLGALDADLFFWSTYKFYGPHLGVGLIKEDLAEMLDTYRVAVAPSTGPEKFETGSQNWEAIAGLNGTMQVLGSLVGGTGGEGAREAIGELGRGQVELADWTAGQLRELPGITVFRADPAEGDVTPTVAFRLEGRTPRECTEILARRGFFITFGDLYASALAARLGVADDEGWARIGVSGYNTWAETEALVEAIADL